MIINFNDLQNLRNKLKDKKIVLAIGTFDLFHYEHLRYLQDAKKQGDVLVVIIKDNFIAAKKGNGRPIIEDYQRIEIIDALACVDYTILTSNESICEKFPKGYNQLSVEAKQWIVWFYEIIKQLQPDILYHENTEFLQAARKLAARDFDVKLVSRKRTAIITTTKIINKIRYQTDK